MPNSQRALPVPGAFLILSLVLLLVLSVAAPLPVYAAARTFVRVNQAGYEAGSTARAYLMTTAKPASESLWVVNDDGRTAYSAKIGALVGTWAHTATQSYNVYALDFSVPAGIYKILVNGDVTAVSPRFAVDAPDALYSGLLLNTLFFYETERDGPNYIQNALRAAPGHLKDGDATRYKTPVLCNLTFEQVTFTPKLLLKDMDLGMGAAKTYGVAMPAAAATRESVARMVGHGLDNVDFAILLQETAKDAGLTMQSLNLQIPDGLSS